MCPMPKEVIPSFSDSLCAPSCVQCRNPICAPGRAEDFENPALMLVTTRAQCAVWRRAQIERKAAPTVLFLTVSLLALGTARRSKYGVVSSNACWNTNQPTALGKRTKPVAIERRLSMRAILAGFALTTFFVSPHWRTTTLFRNRLRSVAGLSRNVQRPVWAW